MRRRRSFLRELVVALVASLVGGAAFASLTLVLEPATALRAAITLVAFVCLIDAFGRSTERSGRVVVVAVWCAIAGGAWAFGAPLAAFVGLHAGLLWLARSLYAETGFVGAAADLILTAVSLAFAVWAATATQSFFLATWCFLLIQSLHVFVPAALGGRAAASRAARAAPLTPGAGENDSFDVAFRAAEGALRRLARGQ
jgi:hypothetical protein